MPVAPEHVALLYPGPYDCYLYGRASRDPSKKGRSVKSQLDEGRDLCKEHGWPILEVFEDIDRSASRYAKKTRDRFESMIEGIEAGKVRIVVAWEASRYYRDLEVYIRLRNACAAAGVLLCYNGTVYDLSKRADRKATAQDALQAEDEAEGIRDRNLRTMRANAKEGRPHGRILWGYARRYDPDTGDLIEQYPHPDRAKVVVDIFERFAAGETEYSIVRHLRQEHGERLPGIKWEQHHVAGMLRNISYLGRRIHQGKDVGKGTWDPIVEEDLFYAVQRIVKDPGRLTTRDRSVKHLLSGIARCGECEESPHLRVLKNRSYLAYMCGERYDTTMREDKLDAYVEHAVIGFLRSKAAKAAFQSGDQEKRAAAARARMTALEQQLEEAQEASTTFRADGTPQLSIASLGAIEARLMPMIAECKEQSEQITAPPLLRKLLSSDDVDGMWDDELSIEQRRMILRLVVNIRLHKARARGVRTIEPGRIRLTFAGQPGFISGWRRDRGLTPQRADTPARAREHPDHS